MRIRIWKCFARLCWLVGDACFDAAEWCTARARRALKREGWQ
jgi:hypothetical protein